MSTDVRKEQVKQLLMHQLFSSWTLEKGLQGTRQVQSLWSNSQFSVAFVISSGADSEKMSGNTEVVNSKPHYLSETVVISYNDPKLI